jgi:hypothetical protein
MSIPGEWPMKTLLAALLTFCLFLALTTPAISQEEGNDFPDRVLYEGDETGYYCGFQMAFFGDGDRELIVISNKYGTFEFLFGLENGLTQQNPRDFQPGTPIMFHLNITESYFDPAESYITIPSVSDIISQGAPQTGVCEPIVPREF